ATLAGRSHSRCTSPRQYASAANLTSLGSLASGSASAPATIAGRYSRATPGRSKIAAPPPVRRFAGGSPNEARPSRFIHQREDQVSMGIEIVHAYHQLAKARLPEILGNELEVALAQLAWGRLFQLRRAAKKVPHDPPAV